MIIGKDCSKQLRLKHLQSKEFPSIIATKIKMRKKNTGSIGVSNGFSNPPAKNKDCSKSKNVCCNLTHMLVMINIMTPLMIIVIITAMTMIKMMIKMLLIILKHALIYEP